MKSVIFYLLYALLDTIFVIDQSNNVVCIVICFIIRPEGQFSDDFMTEYNFKFSLINIILFSFAKCLNWNVRFIADPLQCFQIPVIQVPFGTSTSRVKHGLGIFRSVVDVAIY